MGYNGRKSLVFSKYGTFKGLEYLNLLMGKVNTKFSDNIWHLLKVLVKST